VDAGEVPDRPAIAELALKNPKPAAARSKMSAAARVRPPPFLGRQHTVDTIKKISASKTGKKLSPEHVAKLSAARLGNKNTAGKKMPPGHAEKRRAIMAALWADPVWKAQRLERQRARRSGASS